MSDQSTTASVTGATGAADPLPTTPTGFAALDIVDKLNNLNDRLSVLESRSAGTFTAAHETALARAIKAIFGETLGE